MEPGLDRNPGKPHYTTTIEQNIPEQTVALKEGAKVVSADGQHVGDIQEVFVSLHTKKATHFLITHGMLLKAQRMIPVHWIEAAAADRVDLAVSARLVESLPEYHA